MAEGSGLLNRRTGSTRTVSSNLIPSANIPFSTVQVRPRTAQKMPEISQLCRFTMPDWPQMFACVRIQPLI